MTWDEIKALGPSEPVVVVPHSGGLNRRQRRAQGRYRGFLDRAPKAIHTAPMMLRRSGKAKWTAAQRAKLVRLAEKHAA